MSGERPYAERPAAAPDPNATSPKRPTSGCGLWVLAALAIPVAFGILFAGTLLFNALTGQ